MKKLVKPLAVLGTAGMMLALTACAQLEARPAEVELLTLPPLSAEPVGETIGQDVSQNFFSFSGTVTEIIPYYTELEDGPKHMEGMNFILVENDQESVRFFVDLTTAILFDGEPEVGMELTGYYANSPIMAAVYPPQHRAVVLLQASDYHSMLDRFDENFTSPSGANTLNITDGTEILFQDGTEFEGELSELVGRKLFVEFAEEGRLITPERITVLFEVAVQPIHHLTEEELAGLNLEHEQDDATNDVSPGLGGGALLLSPEEIALMWNNMLAEDVRLTVEGEVIDGPAPFANAAAGAVMLPLAAVAEALGFTVVADGNEVIIAPGTIVTEGVSSVARGREAARELSTAPEMHDGVLFVPWDFFGEILDSGVFIDEGHVYVVTN